MKKILVVSDTHGDNSKLEKLLLKYPDCYMYIHAGDSQTYESQIYPFITVKGNNDYYIDKLYRVIRLDGHGIYLTHGHKNYLSDEVISGCCRNNSCDIFIHGHIHKPYYKKYDGVHILCPGSLAYPRGVEKETYAIILIDGDEVNINIYKYED